ncbi:hypothetical protein GOBAR_AA29227 [Gossypium barbadense]|uniref:Uncharacterized protein n=1 Tax=Gossypium barbadense TaxID=3634 RepID=A0A2P5WK53_GOSBA|nr:hypothetical protein GOBAR_AA29227 [Gossypium barbadense]
MENQPPVKDFGKLPLIEEPEPKTLSKDQYKQAQAAALAAAAAAVEMRSIIFKMKLERESRQRGKQALQPPNLMKQQLELNPKCRSHGQLSSSIIILLYDITSPVKLALP